MDRLHRFWADNTLSSVVLGIFVALIIGMSGVGWRENNNELAAHDQPGQSYSSYVFSGKFGEGVFENWESEFLQMWALVILTIFLRQKGSSESKPLRKKTPQDTSSRYSIINASTWRQRGRAVKHAVYSRSLGLALLALFMISIALHVITGTAAFNEEALQHGEETLGIWQFATTSEFWYQSLQNWQSEFLAVGTLLILTIKLRERGSEQSKPVGKRYDYQTGV